MRREGDHLHHHLEDEDDAQARADVGQHLRVVLFLAPLRHHGAFPVTAKSILSLLHTRRFELSLFYFFCVGLLRGLIEVTGSGTYGDAEEAAVEDDHERDESFEVDLLRDVVDEGAEAVAVRPRRQVQRLGDFQTLFQVAPATQRRQTQTRLRTTQFRWTRGGGGGRTNGAGRRSTGPCLCSPSSLR